MTPALTQLATELDEQKQALVALADAPILEPIPDDLVIVDDVTFTRVGEVAKGIKAAIKRVQERWADIKKSASDHHRKICAQENAELQPLLAAQTICIANMNKFVQLQEADRRRKEREASEAADAERRRLAAAAAEQKAEQDRIAREAAAALKAGDMRKAAELATQAEEKAAEVENTKEEAAAVTEVAVVSTTPKIAGITPRKKWKAVPKNSAGMTSAELIGDVATLELLKAIVAGTVPLRFLTPQRGGPDTMQPIVEVNMAVLNHLATRQQASMAVPGWQAVEETGLAVSAKG